MELRKFHLFRSISRVVGMFSVGILTSCGLPGGVPVSADRVPVGATLTYQGSFPGSSGVSGNVRVYVSGPSILLHLATIESNSATYGVFLETTSSPPAFYGGPLKAASGNQNYFTNRPPPALPSEVFTRVVIRESFSSTATEVTSAALVPIFN